MSRNIILLEVLKSRLIVKFLLEFAYFDKIIIVKLDKPKGVKYIYLDKKIFVNLRLKRFKTCTELIFKKL